MSSNMLTAPNHQLLIDGDWDMVVVDEAHNLVSGSEPFKVLEALAGAAPGLLLLTATPEQLGQESYFERLRLLDPERFHSFAQFIEEEKTFEPIASLAGKILEGNTLSQDDTRLLKEFCPDIAVDPQAEITEGERDRIVRQLIDRAGTSRVIFRNTRKRIQGFPQRHVVAEPLPLPEIYDKNHVSIYPESAFHDDGWCQHDSKTDWLKHFLKQHRNEKTLIICHRKETAIDLQSHFNYKLGLQLALFHEDMDLVARDRAAAFFADSLDGAQALICSEIGSEGRNFQFCQHLVLFDLPDNPDLLEQRIGRLDRIGQKETIHIHIPYYTNHPQEVLFRWYHEGANCIQNLNPAASRLFRDFEAKIKTGYSNPGTDSLDQLLNQTSKSSHDLLLQLEAGKEQLLAINSFDPEKASALVDRIREFEKQGPRDFLEKVCDLYGIEHEPNDESSFVIKPGDHMTEMAFPGLMDEGQTITYDRKYAIARDDCQFMNWEHPVITGSIDMITREMKGKAAVATIQSRSIKPGTLLLELVFVMQLQAPSWLQAQRFLPSGVIRLLLDKHGNNLGDKVSNKAMQQQCQTIDKPVAKKIIDSHEQLLRQLINKGELIAAESRKAFIKTASEQANATYNDEIQRIEQLARINPNIPQSEIDALRHEKEILIESLDKSPCMLDAIRVIFTS
jgi:ATP-dependent helicase HepA